MLTYSNKTVILLTACINPGGMSHTKLQTPSERLQQYRQALDWYLENTTPKIVFVENTGYDLSNAYLNYIREGRLEILTFNGNDFDKSLGKGYGEAIIIEYALNHSIFLKTDCNIIKITGRLICENVEKMAKKYNIENCVYGTTLLDVKGKKEFNSQVFVAPKCFFLKYFLPRKDELDDSRFYWFEHLLYDATKQWIRNGMKFKEMWIPFKIVGISGSSGAKVGGYRMNNNIVFKLRYLLTLFGYYGPLRFWKNH